MLSNFCLRRAPKLVKRMRATKLLFGLPPKYRRCFLFLFFSPKCMSHNVCCFPEWPFGDCEIAARERRNSWSSGQYGQSFYLDCLSSMNLISVLLCVAYSIANWLFTHTGRPFGCCQVFVRKWCRIWSCGQKLGNSSLDRFSSMLFFCLSLIF